jgi:hypothetical protein
MTDTAITETSEVINKLTDAYPAYAVIIIVLIGVGVILYLMQRMQNQFLCKLQQRSEEREDKIITFVGNYAAAAQSDTDSVRELSRAIPNAINELNRVVTALNKDCRAKFKEIDDNG